jgi:hypothetical protein
MNSASDAKFTLGIPTLVLALVGLVSGLYWWSLAHNSSALSATVFERVGAPKAASIGSVGTRTTELAPGRARRSQRLVATTPILPQLADRAPSSSSERALREKYLALETSHPGSLAAHAQEWLGAKRPAEEKVAWLLAMNDSDASAALPWLESACKLNDSAGVHGEAPSSFALELITKLSVSDAAARAALGRVAVDSASVDVALRRRAASSFAALADASELEMLEQGLLHESDEALRAGVVVALEARTDPQTRSAACRLLAWLRPASAAFLARRESGNP